MKTRRVISFDENLIDISWRIMVKNKNWNGSIISVEFGGNGETNVSPLKRVILLWEEGIQKFSKNANSNVGWQIEGLAIEGTKNGKSSFALEYRGMLHSKRDF